jgi:hypothetical protein
MCPVASELSHGQTVYERVIKQETYPVAFNVTYIMLLGTGIRPRAEFQRLMS